MLGLSIRPKAPAFIALTVLALSGCTAPHSTIAQQRMLRLGA
jgi:hypothetical protein